MSDVTGNDLHENDANTASEADTLQASIYVFIKHYLARHVDVFPSELYRFFQEEVERVLLLLVFSQAKGNESKAARWLGLSRGTLRKRLKKYGITRKAVQGRAVSVE